MENEIIFDFDYIEDYEDFYSLFRQKFEVPDWFGDNLDALYDFLSGDLKLPLHLSFVNFTLDKLESFEDLLETLEDAENEIEGFTFSYYMEQFDADDF